jgi:anthranilate phosphoribosyltransferase
VLLNSAAAIHIARPELSLADALVLAREIIDSGKAREQLERFIRLSAMEPDAEAEVEGKTR